MAECDDAMTSDKDKLIVLYRRQVPGTENLYVHVGYFMRMRLWDTINDSKVTTKIMQASTRHEFSEIYKYMIDVMNAYIKSEKTTDENANNMICNRNQIRALYDNNPEEFVARLRECLQKEHLLLGHHNEIPPHSSQVGSLFPVNPSSSSSDDDNVSGCGALEDSSSMECDRAQPHSDSNTPFTESVGISEEELFEPDVSFLEKIETEYKEFQKLWKDLQQQLEENVQSGSPPLETNPELIHKPEDSGCQWFPMLCQVFVTSKKKMLELMEEALVNLKRILDHSSCRQALSEVDLLPKVEEDKSSIAKIFDRYAHVLTGLYESLGTSKGTLDNIVNKYMEMALIVLNQPIALIPIAGDKKESEKGSKSENKNGSKSNESKIFNTKAKIESTLQILGGQLLPPCKLDSYSVTLTGMDGNKAGKLSVPNDCCLTDRFILSFQGIRLQDYTRMSGKDTRNQFVHLSFIVTVSCFQRQFELKTKSLVFNLYSGAEQLIEFMGARMWYVFGCTISHSNNSPVFDKLPAQQVLQMLDKRISSISRTKKRGLSSGAREFLLRLIPSSKKTKTCYGIHDTIPESDFSKTPVLNRQAQKKKAFKFVTWFQACVNTIENVLLQPWLDGVLYDLMMKEEANQVLLNDSHPPKTCLIRPVTSAVKNPCSHEASLDIAVHVKHRSGDGDDDISIVVLKIKSIKKHCLADALRNVVSEATGERIIENLLTSKGTLVSLDKLKVLYPNTQAANTAEKSDSTLSDYHSSLSKRLEMIQLVSENPVSSCSPAKSIKYNQEDCSQVRRRKPSRPRGDGYSMLSPTTASNDLQSPASTSNSVWSPASASNSVWSPASASNSVWSPASVSNGLWSPASTSNTDSVDRLPFCLSQHDSNASPGSAQCTVSNLVRSAARQDEIPTALSISQDHKHLGAAIDMGNPGQQNGIANTNNNPTATTTNTADLSTPMQGTTPYLNGTSVQYANGVNMPVLPATNEYGVSDSNPDPGNTNTNTDSRMMHYGVMDDTRQPDGISPWASVSANGFSTSLSRVQGDNYDPMMPSVSNNDDSVSRSELENIPRMELENLTSW